jgi:hypothetical protein
MRKLWTFENRDKMDLFAAILKEADIHYENQSLGKNLSSSNEVTISVDENEYERAKKILMKYRKRKTTT